MPTRKIDLTEHFDHLITAGIASGRFSNASEVVLEGLRLFEQRQAEDKARVEWLRTSVQEGFDAIAQGDYTLLETPGEIDSMIADVHREVMAEQQFSKLQRA